jgi:hypothetical protein
MERIALALRDLLISHIAATQALTADALAGSTTLKVADTSKFRVDDEIFMMQGTSAIMAENSRLVIQAVTDYQTLELNAPLANDFLVANTSFVQKAINYQILKTVYIGDLPSQPIFPSITISPMSEDNEWLTLRGTTHDYKFQIRAYVLADNYETTNLYLPKLARYIREILIDHIHPLVDATYFPLQMDISAGATVVTIANTSKWNASSIAFLRDRAPRPSSEENSIATVLDSTHLELRGPTQFDYLVARGAEIILLNRFLYDTRPSGIQMGFSPQKGGTMLKAASIDYFAKEYICREGNLIT